MEVSSAHVIVVQSIGYYNLAHSAVVIVCAWWWWLYVVVVVCGGGGILSSILFSLHVTLSICMHIRT